MTAPTLSDTIAFAAKSHGNQKDKAGRPYILHPLRVMLAVDTDEERRVALLHDVIEDCGVTPDELRERGYPDREVAALVALTKRPEERDDYVAFIERVTHDALASRVKLADLEDNMDIRRLGTFAEADASRLQKYHAAWIRLGGRR